MRKVSISASIEMDIAAQLAAEAQRRGESLSQVVNRILQAHISEKAQKPRSGRVVTVTQASQLNEE
jgi:hypothetical protein